MSKLKKALIMCTTYVLVAALAIGGTVAYLQDKDSDVNVMTLGNVSIEQHEYERVVNDDGTYKTDNTGYVLKDFSQAKPLLPATELDANGAPYNYGAGDYGATRVKMSQVDSHGSMDVFVNKNVQDKFVTVENTGKTDAYVRSIIALEIGSLTDAEFDEVIKTSSFMTEQGVWKVTEIGIVAIDGNNYFVYEYIYNGAKSLGGVHENGVLPAGDTTYPSLAQVYMTGTATNEDCEKIDGNKNGTYDILVLSQAVQAAGFDDAKTALDTAFGKSSEKAAEWFEGEKIPVVVSTQDDMRNAMKTPGAKIVLADDVVIDDDKGTGYALYAKYDCEIDLHGHTIEVNLPGKDFYGMIYALNGAKVDFVGNGNVEINGGVGQWVWCTGASGATEINIYGGNWTQNSDDFASDYCEGLYANRAGVVNIYGGMFDWAQFSKYTINESREGVVNVYGGTFVNFNPAVSHDSDGSYVAEGYKVVSETQANGDVWYTVVAE